MKGALKVMDIFSLFKVLSLLLLVHFYISFTGSHFTLIIFILNSIILVGLFTPLSALPTPPLYVNFHNLFSESNISPSILASSLVKTNMSIISPHPVHTVWCKCRMPDTPVQRW